MLVFMTDGLPTVGERNVDKIISNLRSEISNSRSGNGVRIFPFGFGYDVNTTLLDRLGSENNGISDYVQPKEDLEVKVSNFFSRVSSPVLSDLEIDYGRRSPTSHIRENYGPLSRYAIDDHRAL
jgi:Ca-activated chloride channel family protein